MLSNNNFFLRDNETTAILASLPDTSIYISCVKYFSEQMQNIEIANKKTEQNKEFFQAVDFNAAMENFIIETIFKNFQEQAGEEAQSQADLAEKHEAAIEKWREGMQETFDQSKASPEKTEKPTNDKMDEAIKKIDSLIVRIQEEVVVQQKVLDEKLEIWKEKEWTEEKIAEVATDAYEKSGFDAGFIFGNDAEAEQKGKSSLIESAEKTKAVTDVLKHTVLGRMTEEKASLLEKNNPGLSKQDAYVQAAAQESRPRMDLMAQIRNIGALRQAGKTHKECFKIGTGLTSKEDKKLKALIQENEHFVKEAKNYQETKKDRELMAEVDSMFGNLFLNDEDIKQVAKLDNYNLVKKLEIDQFRNAFTDQIYAHQQEAIANRAELYAIQANGAELISSLEATKNSLNEARLSGPISESANAMDATIDNDEAKTETMELFAELPMGLAEEDKPDNNVSPSQLSPSDAIGVIESATKQLDTAQESVRELQQEQEQEQTSSARMR
ncbi:MAG: hypothetical protein P4M14_01385 [Gammaproteobacteria bacterium]|nr:hypothetical protein [Gammaproteobacteria bacterium]